jgi:HlyD family secretion protein
MHLTRRRWVWLGTIVVVGAALVRMAWPEALEVEMAPVEPGVLRVTVDEPARTRMRRHTDLTAPVSGRLAEALVTAGDSVRAGAVVAELRPAPLDPRSEAEARAAARAAGAAVGEAEARVRQAALSLGEAQRNRQRLERLGAAGGVSVREVDAAVATEGLAARELEAARARERAAQQEEARALAALRGAGTGGASAQGSVVRLRSPMTGRVLRVFEEHDRVVPAGTPLLSIGDVSTLEVVIEVLSRDAVSMSPGQVVIVRLPTGDSTHAAVTRVEPGAFTKTSALGIEEQRVIVVARFPEPPTGLGDGYEVQASVVLWEGSDVLTVPAAALVAAGEAWGVFVVRGGRARLRPVEIGHRGTQRLEVLRGVAAGDTVIVHPDTRVVDGVRVARRGP